MPRNQFLPASLMTAALARTLAPSPLMALLAPDPREPRPPIKPRCNAERELSWDVSLSCSLDPEHADPFHFDRAEGLWWSDGPREYAPDRDDAGQ